MPPWGRQEGGCQRGEHVVVVVVVMMVVLVVVVVVVVMVVGELAGWGVG